MLSRRSFRASTFTCPTVFEVAISWRLILVMQTRSESTIVRCVIPERTRLSAHHEPTPPTPKMITRFWPMLLITSSPNRSSALRKIGCVDAILSLFRLQSYD